jgi:hypothetical protein
MQHRYATCLVLSIEEQRFARPNEVQMQLNEDCFGNILRKTAQAVFDKSVCDINKRSYFQSTWELFVARMELYSYLGTNGSCDNNILHFIDCYITINYSH